MRQTYHLPVRVEIESDNPDVVMREMADAMYDALKGYMTGIKFDDNVKFSEIEFSIYYKADKETFGKI